jgi:hypothetical protein
MKTLTDWVAEFNALMQDVLGRENATNSVAWAIGVLKFDPLSV